MNKILTMPEATYHADPCLTPSLSASIIHVLCSQSPRHAWVAHPKLNPAFVAEEAGQMDIGKVCHALMLEGIDVAEWLPFPDWRTNAAKEAREAARAAGKVPILEKHREDILAMVAAARVQLNQHRDAKRAFMDGKPEQTLIWEEDGIACRARLDWIMNDHSHIYDYKTRSGSANPDQLSRTLFAEGWDCQAAWYVRGLKAITGKDVPFSFVLQETFPPYALSVVALDDWAMVQATKKCMWAVEKWAECLASGVWPGYSDRTESIRLHEWMETAWNEKELNGVHI